MEKLIHFRITAVLLIIASLSLSTQMYGQTEVLEDVTQDTTWDISGSPYIIMKASGRILIPQDVTLTIEPGVRVEFPGTASMISIKGTLNAIGTSANPVVFTRGDGFTEYWHTLEFDGSNGKGLGTLQYCTIEGGGAPLDASSEYDGAISCIYAAAPTIDNCLIKDSRSGIYATKVSLPVITNNTIQDCERYGLCFENSSPQVTGNTITGNQRGAAIQVTTGDGSTYPQYDNNTFGTDQRIVITGTQQNTGTWENPGTPYYINEELQLQKGVTLTIEPGTEIQFGAETDQFVVRGTLLAQGTAAEPILFTKDPDFTGMWHGLDFSGSMVNASILEYVEIEYGSSDLGGETFVGAIRCVSEASPQFSNVTIRNGINGLYLHTDANPSIDHCTFEDNTDYGMYIINCSPLITNSTFQGNGIGGIYLHTLSGGKAYPSFEGNTFASNNRIHLEGNADQTGTIEAANIPYVISQTMIVQDVVTLTVEPGVEFQFQNATDKLTVYGTLLAQGESGNEVKFTNAPELTEPWEGIEFMTSTADNSELTYCTIENAGGTFSEDANEGAFTCMSGASPSFRNCTIQNSQNGIYCYDKANPTIENCTIQNNNRFGINVVNSSPSISGCTITGNTAGGLGLNTSGIASTYPTYSNNTWGSSDRIVVIGNVKESGTWRFANTPYLIEDEFRVDDGATLTVEAGVEIQFLTVTSGMKINNSRILAEGTVTNPITFTRSPELEGDANPANRYWNQVLIFGATEEQSEFRNCIFEYGGYTILPGSHVGIIAAESGATPYIMKSIIRNSSNIGICVTDDACPTVWSCMIYDNTEYGAYNDIKTIIPDMRENWWGDPTGPYDPSDRADDPTGLVNAGGLGDNITNYIDYSDWNDIASSVSQPASTADFTLHQNYPNPFNPSTTISFTLATQQIVALDIYDANGKHIQRLVEDKLAAGTYNIEWNASALATGTYYSVLSNGQSKVVRSMILAK